VHLPAELGTHDQLRHTAAVDLVYLPEQHVLERPDQQLPEAADVPVVRQHLVEQVGTGLRKASATTAKGRAALSVLVRAALSAEHLAMLSGPRLVLERQQLGMAVKGLVLDRRRMGLAQVAPLHSRD
jgi:hypothetical protein